MLAAFITSAMLPASPFLAFPLLNSGIGETPTAKEPDPTQSLFPMPQRLLTIEWR